MKILRVLKNTLEMGQTKIAELAYKNQNQKTHF